MKKIDKRFLSIVLSLVVVIYLAIDFKLKIDSSNENYQQLNTTLTELRLNFIEHIDITKDSIINIHFNNDHFIEHFTRSKKIKSHFLDLRNKLAYDYPELFDYFELYNNSLKDLKHNTHQFIKENAMIKNSISILELNTNQYISIYDEKYLNYLIILLNEFKNTKNDMSSNRNVSEEVYNYILSNKTKSDIHEINYIHTNLIYGNI
ncbi:MAG: hypothetical protein U9Q04_10590 [Campylobacterota bacterium]|nr:hypothetical protein [Campylobacterota bacterium]